MRRIRLGNTPLVVSRLAYGTGPVDHHKARLTPEEGGVLLKRAFDLGVNFWDAADGYKTHPHVREGLRGLDRRQIVLTSKTLAETAEAATADVTRFLDELGTDYLDVVHLHHVDSPEDFEARRPVFRALLDAKAKGLVRHVGLSTHSATTAQILPELYDEGLEVSLIVLNKTGTRQTVGTVAEMEAAARRAYDRGVGLYTMKVLGNRVDLAEHTPEELIGHNLALPYIHALVIGMVNVRELEENVAIVERLDRR